MSDKEKTYEVKFPATLTLEAVGKLPNETVLKAVFLYNKMLPLRLFKVRKRSVKFWQYWISNHSIYVGITFPMDFKEVLRIRSSLTVDKPLINEISVSRGIFDNCSPFVCRNLENDNVLRRVRFEMTILPPTVANVSLERLVSKPFSHRISPSTR